MLPVLCFPSVTCRDLVFLTRATQCRPAVAFYFTFCVDAESLLSPCSWDNLEPPLRASALCYPGEIGKRMQRLRPHSRPVNVNSRAFSTSGPDLLQVPGPLLCLPDWYSSLFTPPVMDSMRVLFPSLLLYRLSFLPELQQISPICASLLP